jgi:hypothetical protein
MFRNMNVSPPNQRRQSWPLAGSNPESAFVACPGLPAWDAETAPRVKRQNANTAPTETRDLLAPIYGGFTEGFDTPVLKKAKALLDQLM